MKRQLLLVLSLPLGIALAGWWWHRQPTSTVESAPESRVSAASGSEIQVPAPRVVAKPKALPKVANTKFVTPKEIEQLKEVVIDVQDTVDTEKRQQAFQASGLDTPEHLNSALAIVREDYPETPTEPDTAKRVLALHFLELSTHLDSNGCTEMLRHSIGKFTSAPDKRHAQPYLWDLHDIGLTCTKIDPKGMQELQRSIEHPKVSAQLKLVLKTKGVI